MFQAILMPGINEFPVIQARPRVPISNSHIANCANDVQQPFISLKTRVRASSRNLIQVSWLGGHTIWPIEGHSLLYTTEQNRAQSATLALLPSSVFVVNRLVCDLAWCMSPYYAQPTTLPIQLPTSDPHYHESFEASCLQESTWVSTCSAYAIIRVPFRVHIIVCLGHIHISTQAKTACKHVHGVWLHGVSIHLFPQFDCNNLHMHGP